MIYKTSKPRDMPNTGDRIVLTGPNSIKTIATVLSIGPNEIKGRYFYVQLTTGETMCVLTDLGGWYKFEDTANV